MARQATLELLADASKLKGGLKDAEGHATSFGDTFSGIGKIIGGVVAGGAVLKFGGDAVKAFTESAESQGKLELALKNSKATVGVHADAFAKLNAELAKHTLADDDAIAATEAQMVTFGASKKQIESMIPVVMDFAAKMGVSGPEAADLFDKASLGSVKALKTLGIEGYKSTHDKAKDLANIQALLKDRVKGAAQAQLDAAGPGAQLKKHMDELEETVGSFLVPALTKAATALSGVVDWLGSLVAVFKTGGFSAVISEISDQFNQLWPKVQAILSAALTAIGSWIVDTAGPYLKAQFPVWVDAFWQWIVNVTPPALKALGGLLADVGAWLLNTGLPALGTALLDLTVAAWHWIQDVTPPALRELGNLLAAMGAWILTEGIPKLVGFLANMAAKLIDWIADVVPQLPGKFGVFIGGVAAWVVTTGIPKIIEFGGKMSEALLQFLVDAAKAAPGKIRDVLEAVATWMREQGPGLLGDAVKLIVAAIEAPFKFMFNTIAGFWNNTLGNVSFTVPDWVPGLGGKGFSFPKITPLAAGGIVTGPTLALLGESGPEMVTPLGRGGGGGVTINVSSLDPRGAADAVMSAIREYEQRSGKSWRQT